MAPMKCHVPLWCYWFDTLSQTVTQPRNTQSEGIDLSPYNGVISSIEVVMKSKRTDITRLMTHHQRHMFPVITSSLRHWSKYGRRLSQRRWKRKRKSSGDVINIMMEITLRIAACHPLYVLMDTRTKLKTKKEHCRQKLVILLNLSMES